MYFETEKTEDAPPAQRIFALIRHLTSDFSPHMQSRRHFIRQSAATLFAAPWVTTGVRAASPNGKLRHAAFGASGMSMLGHDRHVESSHVGTRGRVRCGHPQLQEGAGKKWPNINVYQDWRELLEKESANIDSVNVSTPDHMHGPIGLAAIANWASTSMARSPSPTTCGSAVSSCSSALVKKAS
jgi:hypothetical protein